MKFFDKIFKQIRKNRKKILGKTGKRLSEKSASKTELGFRRDLSRNSNKKGKIQGNSTEDFRRGVVLGGGFSVHDREHREKLLRKKQRELKRRRRILLTFFFAALVVLAFGSAILSQFRSSVNVSQKQGDFVLDKNSATKYEKAINEYFASRPLERFSFSYNRENLNQYVAEKAPEILSAKIVSSGLMSGSAELTFREPVAMWQISGDTSYVDSRGVVFQKNYFATPTLAIEDESNINSIDGMVASARFLSFVGRVASEINRQMPRSSVKRIVIPATALRYAEMYLSGKKYPIKIQIDRDPLDQAQDVVAAVKYFDRQKILPQYIDARVSGKVYWR